ncbi:hypothetical protein CO172_01335 [Candidatus Uhrbacteria bacterium CG_4_9_14_3_um_filter_36_7]|uniref:Uncharacterized protein n=1 Tax=Candidatus Uhrbacteria bacterium CG_4_9_14_3_um_filter_36_7 TaxID=1975033 RepID=A0A2M7XHW5_9BACT|nr:MAG: hypothetical protein CO172_01335 [Candidatus Uhrbacteria bacterium CG_4_9_14_3_um_filter_36_7]
MSQGKINTLIIGTSGTGKTYLVNQLKIGGVKSVFDADYIPGVGEWRNHKTNKTVLCSIF